MSHLADTNILLRLSEPGTAACRDALDALAKLNSEGEDIYVAPQNYAEFWNAATRPADRNGLGWTVAQTDAAVASFESLFLLLPDTAAVYPEWRRLVVSCR
jgi:hypothetical protein